MMNLFQQIFNCKCNKLFTVINASVGTGQVSVCRLDGGNIIFMNNSMPNGDTELASDSDSDSGKQ